MNGITTAAVEDVRNEKFSIGVNVNDNLSVSYEEEESVPSLATGSTTTYTMTSSGIQAAYTMGGMTLGAAMNDHENAGYTKIKTLKILYLQ